jgi:hypothetical protein
VLDNHIARSLAQKTPLAVCRWRRQRLFDRLGQPGYNYEQTYLAIEDWQQVYNTRRKLDLGELADDPTPYEEERFLAADAVKALDDEALVTYHDEAGKRLEDGWEYMDEHGEGDKAFALWWRLLARYEVATTELGARRAKP